jgi:sialidase-1
MRAWPGDGNVTTRFFFTGVVLPSIFFTLLYFPALKRSLALVSPYPKATLRKRLCGAAVDGLLVGSCLIASWHARSLAYAGAAMLYLLLRDAFGGQSLGKLLVGHVVVHVDTGQRCRLTGSMKRNLLLIVPGATLVAIVLEARTLVRDPQGQRLGDRVAHTQVVEGFGARDVVEALQQWWARFLAELPRAATRPDRGEAEEPARACPTSSPRLTSSAAGDRLLPLLIRAWAGLVVVGSSAAVVAQAPLPGPRFTEVYQAGEAGFHTFRIPSLLTAGNGTLLAFAEARREGAADAGDIDLVLKRSVDGGVSWSALRVVGDDGANTVGNPCPVVDRTTGTIWLLTTRNRGSDRERDIIAGTSQGTRTVWVQKSTDDGGTWSAAVEITASVKPAGWTWYATGPGIGIQTRAGRLVIPANHAEKHAESGTGVHRSHIVYSDDGGAHWTLGGSADAGTNESQVVELSDGRLLLNMRNHPPKADNARLVAISHDGGRTLSAAVPDWTLIEPPAQASLIALGKRQLVFANPASTKRERLTVRLSEDDGETWPIARVVHEGPAAYSSLAALPDGSIGLLFERGDRSPYERITFARLTRDWLAVGQASGGTTVR